MEQARLVEPEMKFYIGGTLRKCRAFKDRYINKFFNISMFCLFITIFSLLLYYKYKGKLTAEQKQIKERQKQEYIISKLQQLTAYKKQKRIENGDLITDLPTWGGNPEINILNRSTVF